MLAFCGRMASVWSFVLVLCFPIITESTINGQIFADELDRIAKTMGMTHMQHQYDRMMYKEESISGQKTVTDLSVSLSNQFTAMEESLRAVRRRLEEKYPSFPSSPTMEECCKAKDMPLDTRFSANVSFDRGCLAISGSASQSKVFPVESVVDVMKDNHKKNPNLLWQYFGSKDGVLLNYPASNRSECQTYDPRFKQYFVSTASPVPKDVVILFDTSESMKEKPFVQDKPLLQLVKDATAIVLETLSPIDRVGVVAFNDETYTTQKDSCYEHRLARATSKNKEYIRSFVNNKGSFGGSNYEKAMTAAFKFFNSSANSLQREKRDKIILFLTSGVGYTGDPLEVIRSQNEALNNEVIIHAFLLGIGRSGESFNLLRNMTRQTRNNNTFGSIRVGLFENVTHEQRLNTAMGEYYLYSSHERKEEPVFSEPFLDPFSEKGLLIAMCLPVNVAGQFVGVVCTDFRLNELLLEVAYLQKGDRTYAFAIDGFGRTLVHPLLPQRRLRTDNPEVVDIGNFERAQGVDEIIKSMKIGNSGNKPGIITKFAISRGTMLLEGDTTKTISAHYYWTKVEKSNISLCIVRGEEVTNLKELDSVPVNTKGFYYHNREVQDYGAKNCKHYARWATKDFSCVMLAPSSFKNTIDYLYIRETQGKIKTYEDYLRGYNDINPGFKDTLKNSIAATYTMESFWKRSGDESKFVWRYTCSRDGVTRIYPCVQLTKDYDPKLRPWYQKTISKPNTNVVTYPYVDAWGAGYLITFSRTMYVGKVNGQHSKSDEVLGVVGADFTIQFINQLMHSLYPDCGKEENRCIMIDDSGFLVMHPDFVDGRRDPKLQKPVHLGSKEGDISRDLISQGIMYRESCLDVEFQKEQYTYRVVFSGISSEGLDRMDDKGYEIRPVSGSNLAIILKKRTTQSTVCCTKPDTLPTNNKCGSELCDCLCYKDVEFNLCENEYAKNIGSPSCSARPQQLLSISPNETKKTRGLESCFRIDCCSKTTSSACLSVAGCAWCEESRSEILFPKPFCVEQHLCPFGKCIEDRCEDSCKKATSEKPTEASQISLPAAIGGSLAGIAVIVIVVCIICYYLRRPNPAADYLDAIDVGTREGYDNTKFTEFDHFDNQRSRGIGHEKEIQYESTTSDSERYVSPSNT